MAMMPLTRLLQKFNPSRRITLLFRSVLLLSCSLIANLVVWIASIIIFRSYHGTSRLSLCLLAWTLGLRHGLDADHISAIDNATRVIVSLPHPEYATLAPSDLQPRDYRRPVTVGLFFSLGHSTIVCAVTIAIAVSTTVIDRLGGVSDVGGVIGQAVSGGFLAIVGVINTVILTKTWMAIRREKKVLAVRQQQAEDMATRGGQLDDIIEPVKPGSTLDDPQPTPRFNSLLTRLILPLLRLANRPYKLYPIGILFGLGFDTASSIALLSVSIVASTLPKTTNEDGNPTMSDRETGSHASVVLLALLFTAGMSLVDSMDSVLMVWGYVGYDPREERRANGGKWSVWEPERKVSSGYGENDSIEEGEEVEKHPEDEKTMKYDIDNDDIRDVDDPQAIPDLESQPQPDPRLNVSQTPVNSKNLTSSTRSMSLILTLLSILIAFTISLITILSLIGSNCSRCTRAADQQESYLNGESDKDGGLEGRWWLAWRNAGDQSGAIGGGVVGVFAVVVGSGYLWKWVQKKRAKRRQVANA